MNRSNTPAALLSWLLGTVTLVVLFLGSNRNGVDAFSISGAPSSVQVRSGMNLFLPSQQRQHPQKTTTTTMIHMSLEDDQQQEQAETEKEETDVVADSTDEDVKEADDEATPEEEEEDPELTALKEEIASLETTLKEVRRKLAYTNDLADDFTKTGYARKVAEMENMRRARSVRLVLFVVVEEGCWDSQGRNTFLFLKIGVDSHGMSLQPSDAAIFQQVFGDSRYFDGILTHP
jgi:hypothetical protein